MISNGTGPEPGMDLVSFAFDHQVDYDHGKPLYIDALDSDRCLNARQLRTLVQKLTSGFKNAGVRKGDRVLIHLFNSYLYSAIFFGIVGAGGTCVCSNPAYRLFELDHLFKQVQPTLIITAPDFLDNIRDAATRAGISHSDVYCLDAGNIDVAKHSVGYPSAGPSECDANTTKRLNSHATKAFEDLLIHGGSTWQRINDVETAKATPATLFSTSGTSGLPKAAVLSHNAFQKWHQSLYGNVPYQRSRVHVLPSFHGIGSVFSHVYAVRYGEPLYIFPRFNAEHLVDTINKFRITDLVLSPQMVSAIIGVQRPLKEYLRSVRWVVCGGESLSAALQQELHALLPREATVSQLWGMSEIGGVTAFLWPEQDLTGSIGRCLPGNEIKLVDESGREVIKEGELGHAYVRGEQIASGYWNMSDSWTPLVDSDGWVRTGDVMSVKDGKYYIRGRAKELIKVKGWQVAPAEIETVLRKHPRIADVGVSRVLRPDGRSEVPRAYVVRKEGATLSADEVYQFAKERLASYKALDGGVAFVERLPRTAIGKLQRFALQDLPTHGDESLHIIEGPHSSGDNFVNGHVQGLPISITEDRKA